MKDIARERNNLQAHRILLRAALSVSGVFAWIFIFQYFLFFTDNLAGSFASTMLVYALSQAIMMILTPLSASHLRRGVKSAMIFGSLFFALSLAVLGATFAGYFSNPLGWGVVLFAIFMGTYRALYWIPYRLQSAHSLLNHPNIFLELLIAFMPAFVGVALVMVSIAPLKVLFGAAAFALLSCIPVLFMADSRERFSWGYVETFARLFDRSRGTYIVRSTLEGIESASLFLMWPLAIFLILGQSYFLLGLVMSASLTAFLLLHSFYRVKAEAWGIQKSPIIGTIIVMSAWIFRLTAGSPIAIIVADSYAYTTAPRRYSGVVTIEHVPDGGTYLDEHTALHEIALGIGRILACAFTALMLLFVPLLVALGIAITFTAFAAGGAYFLGHRAQANAY